MGLVDTLKTWLEGGSTTDKQTDTPTDDTDSEEPKLDPNGATETRIKTTDTAVDALKETRSEGTADEVTTGSESREPHVTDDQQ